MACASCGQQIPAGARYCSHCGAEQSLPTPIAAVAAAAAMARSPRVRAANAAHAESKTVPSFDAANQASAAPASERDDPVPAGPAASPAYAAQPHRRGLAVALVLACILVAVVVVIVGLRILGGGFAGLGGPRDSGEAAAPDRRAAPPAEVTSTATLPAPAPSSDADARVAGSEETAAAQAPPDSTAAAAPPIEIKPLPPHPAQRTARHAAVEKPPAPPPIAAVPPSPATVEQPVAQGAARPSPAADRWAKMDDDLSRCTREDFITRVICGQRVRFRYCDGYWGKVAQCPASPAPERGQ